MRAYQNRLDELNKINDVPVLSVEDDAFVSYGRVLSGYDLTAYLDYMKERTTIPKERNCYVASVKEMEALPETAVLRDSVYGGMPIQVGYCNGVNSSYNGFEYHKGSEINIAVTDFMLALGHSYDIRNLKYDVSQVQVFFVPKGCAVELYQTTLHLSPLKVCREGYRAVVVLPAGTNTPLEHEKKDVSDQEDEERKLLLMKNKWVVAHPNWEPLIRQGAYPGVTGENKCLKYCSIS